MIKKILFPLIVLFFFYGCKTTKTVTLPTQTVQVENPNKIAERPIYQASNTIKFDLIHTKLAVKFNWEKAYMYGKAEITLKPHFYSSNRLVLDARGMNINKVELMGEENTPLKYDYDSLKLIIHLPKKYTKNDTLKIFIDYTAKPNELKHGGSAAITDDKGLYFINPKGKDKNKPQQIWTQGETQSNSVWFPTIDSPNQKSTEEIAITVANKYKTLSNGILNHSELNGNGTRTDFWALDLPHAPYLFMMAIGDFAVVKDKWRDIEVNYYVEHKWEKYAKDIFGLTPEMIEFFSTKLGVDYVWPKYSQIVVRDYVSGAMENTTATIHGDFVYQTKREMIDGSTSEDVISHELFHHWFGDLVTCESWSNLPLNESFATYGEFLWNEYKHGDDKAAEGLQKDLNVYLQDEKQGQVDVVRFNYENREDMFDGTTYQKGGRILHMLRKYVGDKAFFASLKLYLERNKFKAVEMQQLRLAFEKVTGEDLNWFFNEWFYASGHPILNINYTYNDSTKNQTVTVEQMQDLKKTPLYLIPIKIDFYVNGKKETKKVVIDKQKNIFNFTVNQKPDLVNFDADKMLLCEKVDNHKDMKEWAYMFHHAPRYLDRYEAVKKLQTSAEKIATNTMLDALNDKYSTIRRVAIRGIKKAEKSSPDKVKAKLIYLAKNDSNSHVRGEAITALSKYFGDDADVKQIFINGVADQSYYVIGKSLKAISANNADEALKLAKNLEKDKNKHIINAVANIYADHGGTEQLSFFTLHIASLTGFSKYSFIMSFASYLKKQDNKTVEQGIEILSNIALNGKVWWVRMIGIRSLTDLETMYGDRIHVAETELKDLKAGTNEEVALQKNIDNDKKLKNAIKTIMDKVKATEKNPRLRSMLGLKD